MSSYRCIKIDLPADIWDWDPFISNPVMPTFLWSSFAFIRARVGTRAPPYMADLSHGSSTEENPRSRIPFMEIQYLCPFYLQDYKYAFSNVMN
jgi:hypothetical protein